MTSNQKKNIHCPTCGKQNTWESDNSFRPFCSERCKLIDLGEWAGEQYRMPGGPAQPDNNNDDDS
ncbi:DNA gyrase inhibitor YacG [Aquicella lusitana]|mgnify:CR=1 FL=1|uniref:DNA gyrase inhibitor YacG n=1 Tax=Aquicella lusitana TaxID=254246 RepID=A0A370GDM7_9COXI|nr:DNA gyrase inhibitor YacG [Aquicella lusitana]RDI41791.1 hypothetical protein C8D86_1177 [Aquicella lusitana]VVC73700.1 DNA gyrase inhibitor YacG [Aquicella lusitana]